MRKKPTTESIDAPTRELSPWQMRAKSLRARGGTWTAAELEAALLPPSSCYICGDLITWDTAHLDHVNPVARGGTHAVENLRWTCAGCNRLKGPLPIVELFALIGKITTHQMKLQATDQLTPPARRRKPPKHNAELTEAQVLRIVHAARVDGISTAALSATYGVSIYVIQRVLNGRSWGWLTGLQPRYRQPPRGQTKRRDATDVTAAS